MNDYLALLRLDKPIGIWLVFFPAAWGVLLASPALHLPLLLVMLVGAVVARSAGCIINDLTDRKLDASVERTKNRPLASGAVPVMHAYILLGLLLAIAFALAASLPSGVLIVAILAVPMIAAYPWMKRLTWWPQLFLGATFNLGALIGWLSTGASLNLPAFLLYGACIAWTLSYDTIYAMQDTADDARMGIKSTALLLGVKVPLFVTCCLIVMQLLLILTGIMAHAGMFFLLGILLVALHMRWQIRHLRLEKEAGAGKIFQSNQWLGLVFSLCLLVDRLI